MSLIEDLDLARSVLTATMEQAGLAEAAEAAVAACVDTLTAGRPMMVAGNGGSASDAMHITGELGGRFLKERRALNCICLSSNPSVLTAWANDYSFDTVFSRQVEAYGGSGGVLLGLSTSGNSKNLVRAFEIARSMGLTTIGLTGEGGGALKAGADILLEVPSRETPLIQQVHICLYHYLCRKIEARLSTAAA